jgi:hypothetical protein
MKITTCYTTEDGDDIAIDVCDILCELSRTEKRECIKYLMDDLNDKEYSFFTTHNYTMLQKEFSSNLVKLKNNYLSLTVEELEIINKIASKY